MKIDLSFFSLLLWAFMASVTLWPLIAPMLVFVAKRRSIRRPLRYFVSSVFLGYLGVLTIPLLVVVGLGLALPPSGELVFAVTLFISTPLLIIGPLLLSAFCARACR